jgi:L-fuconolactonase
MDVSRRGFVRCAAQAAVAAGALHALGHAAEPPGEPPMLPIVDTHQHLWDLSRFRLPWLVPGGPLTRSFVTKDYLEAAQGLGVEKAVYMEVDVEPSQRVAEAEHVIGLCRRKEGPTVAAVIGGEPAADGFPDYLARFQGSPFVKGVRQVLFGAKADLCRDAAFTRGIRLLGERGLSFDLCLGPERLGDARRLVEACPGTRFVLDHCGNADPKAFRRGGTPSHDPEAWRRDVTALAERRNVACKISGIVANAPAGWTADDLAPIVNHCLDAFGPDRVVFGGDWPVCTRGATLRQWVEALRTIIRPRPEAEQRKLLHDNAVRVYRLG